MNPLSVQTPLLYLDTNFVRNLSRNGGPGSAYASLRGLLRECLNRELIRCPSSTFHEIESELLHDGQTEFRDTLRSLDRGIEFLHFERVLENQLKRPLYDFFGRRDLLKPRRWDEAFAANPDSTTDEFWWIRAEFPSTDARRTAIRAAKEAYADATNDTAMQMGRTFTDLYEEELSTLLTSLFGGNGMTPILRWANLAKALVAPDLPMKQYGEFFSVSTIASVPFLDIVARLYAAMRSYFPQRIARGSDVYDIRSLALSIPYCDVVATDKFWPDLDSRPEMHLGERYGTKILSATRVGVDDLVAYLGEVLRRDSAATPVPTP